jgi:pimeloyl-ACP methyl ester carboxylesterase
MIKTPSRKVKSKKVKVKNQSGLFTFYFLLFPSKSLRLRACALKKSAFIAFVLALSVLFAGCVGGKKVPNLDAIFARAKLRKGKRPVIIIPGILGSELVNSETKERVWINLSTAKTDGLSLPVSPKLTENRDNLVATRIIERAKISNFLPEVSIYEALIQAVEKYGGYTKGEWDNPDAARSGLDKYYVFAYDWRLDNVGNARLLTRKIEELKQKIGDPGLRFNVIAHSMGGLIARYAAMYADTDLPADGSQPVPNWTGAEHFNKIFMFGVPNEGSMATLELLLKGYRVGGFEIDVLNRETAITSPAVFQLLPHQTAARFYDENLDPLDIDLYNPETWKKYGWSAYADGVFRSKFAGQTNALSAAGRKSEFADVSLEEFEAYFANTLRRTKLFHDALAADTAVPGAIAFFAFGSDCDDTQDGVILYKNPKTNAWQTIFTPRSYRTSSGRQISREETRAKLYAPGDTRVTRRSLLAETTTEQNYRNSIFRRNLFVTSMFFCESHNQLPNSKIMQDNFITALVQELTQ